MSFSDVIVRVPIAHTRELADGIAEQFGDVSSDLRELLSQTAGCSPFLSGAMQKEAEWLRRFDYETADGLREDLWAEMAARERTPAALKTGLRQAKRRAALLTALADVAGIWELGEVTGTLTELADRACDLGLRALLEVAFERGKLPAMQESDLSDAGGMVLLAMGKMGAGELNYSSDIDLICLFDESRYEPDDYTVVRTGFVKITRQLMALLSDNTEDGYVFRTDLRLRPDASVTPVCIAMEAAERYYESVGRTWERAAFIKARAAAGDVAAGEKFLQRLAPFIWRKHLDFASIEDAHDMRLRIRDHKGLGGAFDLAGHNMKLGAGGIREIEFFTQTRQIIAGGRDRRLRVRGTLDVIEQLQGAGLVNAEVEYTLAAAYVQHRQVEHRLQMIADAQTHDLPKSDDGFLRLARFMGEGDVGAFRDALEARLQEVARLTEAFFAPDADKADASNDTETYLERWRSYPALRSPRAQGIFRRLFPEILESLSEAADAEGALRVFENFLRGLPAGVQLFSLFEANPQLSRLIADICATSPALADYLSRNAQVFDAVVGGDFFRDWPGVSGLHDDLERVLDQAEDYEAKLDATRRWQKEWHFRIGVHHLRGLISPADAGAQYADLAEATLQGLFPVVVGQFERKHGPAPGRGAAVLGMGSLGAGHLNARSDLDLIVIYDAQGAEGSDGPRPLMTVPYFARLTQALITALTAPTAEGRLYEVDMRLRPSGRAGPVATSLNAFDSYQREEAWVWEHLALTRARVVAGTPKLAADIEAVRADVLALPRDRAKVFAETAEMRDRLADAGRAGDLWDAKEGAGGQKDIELLAQAACVMAGSDARVVAAQLALIHELGWLGEAEVADLAATHDLFWTLQLDARLLTESALDLDRVGPGGLALILRDCGSESAEALEARLGRCRERAAKLVELVLRGAG